MINQWTKKYTYALIGVIVATLIIYGISYFSIINPMQAEIDTMDMKVSMYENQITKSAISENKPNEEFSSVSLQVPTEKSPDDVLVNLENIASTANVTINYIGSNINVSEIQQEDEETKKLSENIYSLDATAANLGDINVFLSKVLESERLMIIDTINIQQDEDQVFLTISFKTYYTG
ncbi:hypothetical protein SAMN05216232_1584 [Virgibacillus subterraneus]|uniref:Uncharacterized protein n=1 Tax=Virgibacillus subterraneus TaxID=621109 RepID=A0A1H9DCG9_9BACI|nr:hypothetical protein [Virgibacillus subterraneus]SEQ11195.1 hypothetical protein SAMN05216232_1584 [Virgibacillus subterraneus]